MSKLRDMLDYKAICSYLGFAMNDLHQAISYLWIYRPNDPLIKEMDAIHEQITALWHRVSDEELRPRFAEIEQKLEESE